MVSILEELGDRGKLEDADDPFDVDQFTEMMEAYLPGFHLFNALVKLFELFDNVDVKDIYVFISTFTFIEEIVLQ